MTTPIAEKTHIPPKNWRRHSDPPILWFFVGISSVSLHLLIFWLLRSSNVFGLWLPQESQVIVPIELIEISPSTKSTSKPKSSTAIVAPKPKISAKQPVTKSLPKTEQTIPKNQASSATILKKQEVVVSQAKTKPNIRETVSQPKPTPTTPKPSVTPESTKSTPTPIPKPTIPLSNLPWNRRQEIVIGKGKPLPNSIPLEQPIDKNLSNSTRNTPTSSRQTTSSTPSSENPNTSARNNSILPTENTPQNSTGKISPTPTPTENTPQPSQKNPSDSKQTGSIATITPLTNQEMRELSRDLPDVLATYQGSNTKKLESSLMPGDDGLVPAKLIASLVIDHNGNFQQAVVIQIEPLNLESEKLIYQQAIQELFKNERFTPASNLDGRKPELSNLFVKVVISPGSLN